MALRWTFPVRKQLWTSFFTDKLHRLDGNAIVRHNGFTQDLRYLSCTLPRPPHTLLPPVPNIVDRQLATVTPAVPGKCAPTNTRSARASLLLALSTRQPPAKPRREDKNSTHLRSTILIQTEVEAGACAAAGSGAVAAAVVAIDEGAAVFGVLGEEGVGERCVSCGEEDGEEVKEMHCGEVFGACGACALGIGGGFELGEEMGWGYLCLSVREGKVSGR